MGGIARRRSAPGDWHEHRIEFRREYSHELHELHRVLAGVDPVSESYMVAFSLAMAVLAPYLVRTYRAVQDRITDPVLAADVRRFVAQDAAQSEHHRRMTETIVSGLDERTAAHVRSILDDLEHDYRHYNHRRSTRFNLVSAEGLEAMAVAMAPPLSDDERRCRTVAFRLYDHLAGGYIQRIVGSLRAQWHFHRTIDRLQRTLLVSHGQPASHHLPPWLIGEGRRRYLRTFGPHYDPAAIDPSSGSSTVLAAVTSTCSGRPAS